MYVSVADLKNAVSSTLDTPDETIDKILELMNQHWSGQDTIDVMMMAECLWRWRYEITDGYNDKEKDFVFDAAMMRIKDKNLVPTIGMRNDAKN